MEVIESLLKTFGSSWKEKNNEAALRALKDAPGYIRNLTHRDGGRALQILFDEKQGVLQFIHTVLNEMRKHDIENLKTALKEAFVVLQILIELYSKDYEPYVEQTRELCFACIKSTCWYYTRRAATETYQQLIEHYSHHDLQLDFIVEHFTLRYLRHYNRKEGCVFYMLIGTIAKSCPIRSDKLTQHVNEIYVLLLKDLKYQYVSCKNKSTEEMKIYIDCYIDMLKNFVPFAEDRAKRKEYLEKCLVEYESFTNIGALRSFYTSMVSYLYKCDNETALAPFQVLIYGLGEFSCLYRRYANSEMHDVFQKITMQALPYYTKEKEADDDFECVAQFLKALAQFVHYMPDASNYHIGVIIELSIYFVKRYGETKMQNKLHATNALKDTFHHMSNLEKNIQHEYFNSFFREGILQSCSHTLLIDVEIKEEIENTKELSYKNYLLLWNDLFKMDNQEYPKFLIYQIFNEMVSVFVSFIDKLNLSIKTCDDETLSGSSFLFKAENELDFLFFINLIDLHSEIFCEVDSCLLQASVEKLLEYFIKCSYKHPMVSGFYKIIKVIFEKPDVFTDYKTSFGKSTRELIPQYLSDVLKLVGGFSDELQLTCIYMIFGSPVFFIKDLIQEMSSIFKIAFHMGLTDLSVAFCALSTLEQWIKSIEYKYPADLIKNIIYYLEPYLSSEESLVESFRGVEKRRGHNLQSTPVLDDQGLEEFQKRILLFYGSLTQTDILFDYIHETSNRTNASWTKKNDLQCDLLFPDIRLEIQFDTFLPRVIELTKSGDIGVKISACELLHTLITIILGKKLMDQCFDKKLCFEVLRLGCDLDDAVRNLYHPFVIQLTHYLSSKFMKDSRVPQDFVDSLFDGLTEEFHTSMRDFCGLYLKEFVQWSMRQSTDADLTNIRAIVRRITSFALFPSNKKRLAAAIAFNNLYTILRENVNIVNDYWLEFLHAFVKSMEEYDDVQTSKALSHVEKVMVVKKNVFVAKSPVRRKPPGFTDETLKGVLLWLFDQCGSINTKCRRQCMRIFENLLPFIPDFEVARIFTLAKVNEVVLANLECEFDIITPQRAKTFLKSLDFYSWIFTKKFLPIDRTEMLDSFTENDGKFIRSVDCFVSMITGASSLGDDALLNICTHKEVEENKRIINEVTSEILNFLTVILNENDNCAKCVSWSENLFLLVVYCLTEPSKVELTANLQNFEKLPSQLESLLKSMKQKLPEQQFDQFKEIFLKRTRRLFLQYAEITDIISSKDLYTLKEFVDGLIVLRKCDVFDFQQKFSIDFEFLNVKLKAMFDALKTVIMNSETCRKLDNQVSEYLNRLMKFFLEVCESDVVEVLVQFIASRYSSSLTAPNGTEITHGKYFLETFKEPILEFMLKDPKNTLKAMEKVLKTRINSDEIFYLVNELLIFAQRQRGSEEAEILSDEVISRFSLFSENTNNIESRKTLFFNINKKAVQLKKNPTTALKTNGETNEFKTWLFLELTRGDSDLSRKTLILKNFATCLVHEDNETYHRDLIVILYQLRDMNPEQYSIKLRNDELLKFQSSLCFKTLLKLIVVTRSTIIYEMAMRFAAGIHKFLSKENIKDYLGPYFSTVSDEKALTSLQSAYNVCMKSTLTQARLDVLRQFLLPSIELCRSSVIEKFYREKSQEMLEHIRKDMGKLYCDPVDRKKLIVSQMACYNMFEVMLAKHEVEFESVPDPMNNSNVEPLNRILIKQIIDLRTFSAQSDDEKEITRLLHCAAVNCSVALISLKDEEKFYKLVFFTNKEKEQLLWERIFDLDRQYDFSQAPSSIRKERKKLINIRRTLKNEQDPSYVRPYDLASLTLLENIHAYDLNDTTVLAQAKQPSTEDDQRLDLGFESDELNEHECMPMLVGVIIHMYNSEIVTLPESENRQLPVFLDMFRSGFLTRHNNARLLLMRIICNTKTVFLHYMREFFLPVCEAAYIYLAGYPLNYVIRDVLVLFIESGFEPITESDKLAAQRLVQNLIPRLPDQSSSVYRYNLEIFEDLCRIFGKRLSYPEALDELATKSPDLAIQVVVVFLRCGVEFDLLPRPSLRKLIRESVAEYSGSETMMTMRFEAMGWYLGHVDEEGFEAERSRLVLVFQQMSKKSQGVCVKCICALYRGCRSETRCRDFFKFARPAGLGDELKPRCLELFLQRVPDIDPLELPVELTLLDLRAILRERILGCEEAALKIVTRLVPLLAEPELRPYLELVASGYTGLHKSLLEHRRLAYAVLAEAYTAYPPPSGIAELCCRALVRALTDPAEEIQQLALGFWRERVHLPDTCCERLLAVLELYEPESRDAFARFLCILALELTSKSIDDKSVMFQPLANCTFRDYEVLVPCRRLNLGSMAPLFAPSLASQINRLSLMGTQNFAAGSLRLVATKDLSFEPTFQFAVPTLPDPSQNSLSKRLIAESPKTYSDYQQMALHRRNEFHKKLKKESEARRSSAKVYRKYRIGDFPDVEITHATFVESLRRFIMKDWLACKSFAVAFVCKLLDKLKSSDKHRAFVDGLSVIFRRVLQQEDERNDFAPVVLEIALHAKHIKVDASAVGKICRSMDLNALGILLLEEESTYSEDPRDSTGCPPSKRPRLAPLHKDNFIQLASLYKSMGMTDVVASIFRQPNMFPEKLQEAALARLECNWTKARQAYEAAYNVTSGAERDHCLDGEFESLAQLGNWEKINRKTDQILDGNYDNVWDDPRKNQLLPWIFEAQLQAALVSFASDEEPDNADFLRHFGQWISESEVKMKRLFGEQIAMFFLCGSAPEEKARHALKCCLEQVRENWVRSSPLSENPRFKMLLQFRAMFNIDAYVKVISSSGSAKIEEDTRDLLKYWDQHLPNLTDDLLSWSKLLTYRLSFMHLLHEKIQNDSEDSDLSNELIVSSVRQRTRMSELAIRNGNASVLKKNLTKIEPIFPQLCTTHPELSNEFELNASKYKFVNRKTATDSKKKFNYYLCSWEVAKELYDRDGIDPTVLLNVKRHLFDLTSCLLEEAKNDGQMLELLTNNIFACDTLEVYSFNSTLQALEDYCFRKLEETCAMGSEKEKNESFAKLGRYCYNLTQNSKIRDPKLDKQLVSSILNGMMLGSAEAARYFPCLLNSKLYQKNEELKMTFSSMVVDVPSWMFLTCKDQVVSYLSDSYLRDLLLPIVARIFDDYPYAIVYDFNQLKKSIGRDVGTDICQRLEHFFNVKGIKEFIKGLHHVCQPELYLKHELLDLFDGRNFQEGVDTLMTDLYNEGMEDAKSKQQGTIYKIVLSNYKEDIKKLKTMDVQTSKLYVYQMGDILQRDMKRRLQNNRRQALQLKDYSPHLAYFSGEDYEIEIPGQYDGSKKPLPQFHVKVAKFDRFVRIMESKCNPIKINVIGNDARSYSYLVKCGEDLRQDQRLQQIFKTTNKTLDADVNCRQRYLSINTYHVLPLSSNLGLIQWVDNTKSLKEYIEFSMKDKDLPGDLASEYQTWIQKAAKSNQISVCYREALVKYSTKEVVEKMTKLTSQVEDDILKKTFATLSPSLECFMSLRHNFITSYATMSVIHWLTGVGDRHLENLLIEVKSGKCYGIDFGLAFGTGIDQSVPELVPFRLGQILGLLKPFDETALLGITMTHVLSALRKEHGPLSAYLDIFIHEPLDWTQNSKWIPHDKIDVVKKKLSGMNPAAVLLKELADAHCQSLETDVLYSKYKTIVTGSDYLNSARSKLFDGNLTPEEQVQCLLEQAKDFNLLGRMWVGWTPFL
ncbi:DNA-dependent protein kinase catalytic subunit-like [Copidosoma floridanum]|uniref:DNA-dependent protein kinase catalytic subunit-like n=1 Tax=Copidosoma floridanum TaxID=29053 RepID=UPI000C6F6A6A|nr:DNA-dependent protein kinase catalytic subunit-like [Copidosoma floridanum]